MKHRKNQANLVADWNKKFNPGQPVYYHPVIGEPERREDYTMSDAYMGASGTAMIGLHEYCGAVSLEAVEPILNRG
jgi:hypothetical protein